MIYRQLERTFFDVCQIEAVIAYRSGESVTNPGTIGLAHRNHLGSILQHQHFETYSRSMPQVEVDAVLDRFPKRLGSDDPRSIAFRSMEESYEALKADIGRVRADDESRISLSELAEGLVERNINLRQRFPYIWLWPIPQVVGYVDDPVMFFRK
jgi:hypothetical protein